MEPEHLGYQLRTLCDLTLDNQVSIATMANATASSAVRAEFDMGVAERSVQFSRLEQSLLGEGWRAPVVGWKIPGADMDTGTDAVSRATNRTQRDLLLAAWARHMLIEEIATFSWVQECALEMRYPSVAERLGESLEEKHTAATRLVRAAKLVAGRGVRGGVHQSYLFQS